MSSLLFFASFNMILPELPAYLTALGGEEYKGLIISLAMVTIAFASTPFQLILGIAIYGFAQGVTSPTLLAWATDLSPADRKGRGVSSLYIFMEFGIGIGAFVSGLLYANQVTHFDNPFLVCGSLAGAAFLYLLVARTHTFSTKRNSLKFLLRLPRP